VYFLIAIIEIAFLGVYFLNLYENRILMFFQKSQ